MLADVTSDTDEVVRMDVLADRNMGPLVESLAMGWLEIPVRDVYERPSEFSGLTSMQLNGVPHGSIVLSLELIVLENTP